MKITFIGTVDSDKTTFFDLIRTNLDGFGLDTNYSTSIGVNIYIKHLYEDDNHIAKLIIWDVSAASSFKWVRPLFYNGSVGAIILHSDNTPEGIKRTLDIIKEFENYDFPKYLLVLTRLEDFDEEQQENVLELDRKAAEEGVTVRFFEVNGDIEDRPFPYGDFYGQWRELRKFYETCILDIFTQTVKKIPGNNYDVDRFRRKYFETIDLFDKGLKKIYRMLEDMNLEHDYRNIYVRTEKGLFSINIFSAACYYHYPDSGKTKYICLVPKYKDFRGWSNIKYLPRNFLLAIAKAFYLLEGKYDAVVRKQLREL